MNRRFVLVVALVLVIDWMACLRGRGRARGRVGSWSQCTASKSWGLSMNLPGHRIAACLGKAALKTRALQTLLRRPLTQQEARSVWSAPDLLALYVPRGTASGSWPQCVQVERWPALNLVAAEVTRRILEANSRLFSASSRQRLLLYQAVTGHGRKSTYYSLSTGQWKVHAALAS